MSTPEDREGRLALLATLIAASPHNLVSRAQRDRVRSDHIAEALAVATALDIEAGSRWVDLGTGGGLPGLVLAVCREDVHWLLVDARRKKALAVAGFAAQLGLRNVAVAAERAETLARVPEHRGAYDGVVARAVGALAVVAELGRGFLRPGGTLACVKGPAWTAERAAAARAAVPLSLSAPEAVEVASRTRTTVVVRMTALGAVPSGVPRRPGVPEHDPLGREEEANRGGT